MSGAPHSKTDLVSLDWRGPVAVVTLTGSTSRNSLDRVTKNALLETLKQASETVACRAIVLMGGGDTFSVGGDEADVLSLEIFQILTVGRRPVVAVVSGLAAAAGMSLAVACDYVVATEATVFDCALGPGGQLPQGAVYWTLGRRIGAGRARHALLTGRHFTGGEALAIGLANELADPSELLDKAVAAAMRYAQMPPLALAWLKAAMATGSDTLDQAIETETNVQPLLRFSEDHNEAVAAFLQKRAPNFVGR
ncbi:enoyl-CoA hydratase/isomerase family protein [Oryzicola mucosus]|uniref:Enoyl-CoA hydratase/isomerase family protein n=1 Tax=Oryzicola mucosus TaxID=2767425 RepID=A0A8J6PXT1_9HYPH|nr:enoyl-CoA hydratase-related protein [Oryzicola mucosus]MBD0417331.1 enoyl-CoA hydratase/isomerase family protein [Oryzicola mucosus]